MKVIKRCPECRTENIFETESCFCGYSFNKSKESNFNEYSASETVFFRLDADKILAFGIIVIFGFLIIAHLIGLPGMRMEQAGSITEVARLLPNSYTEPKTLQSPLLNAAAYQADYQIEEFSPFENTVDFDINKLATLNVKSVQHNQQQSDFKSQNINYIESSAEYKSKKLVHKIEREITQPKQTKTERKTAEVHSTKTQTSNSNATAQCLDGTFSYSKSKSGACSSHGGVAKWLVQTKQFASANEKHIFEKNYIKGARGGCYYINDSNKKSYVDRSMCG